MKGPPVVISTNGKGMPVVPVQAVRNAPKLTVANNGKGFPIIMVAKNAPSFVVMDEAGNILSQGGGVTPVQAPGKLSAAGGTPYIAVATWNIVPGYSGPLFDLTRASGGASQTFAAEAGGDYPKIADMITFAAGSLLSVSKAYWQDGSGRYFDEASLGNQPLFDPTQPFGNFVPILFDSVATGITGIAVNLKRLSVGGLTINRNAHTVLMVAAPLVSYNANAMLEFTSEDGVTNREQFYTGSNVATTFPGFSLTHSGTIKTIAANPAPRAQMQTLGYSTSGTESIFYRDGANETVSNTISSLNMERLTLAKRTGQTLFNGSYALGALVVYSSVLSSGNAQTVIDSLNVAAAIPTAFDYNVLWCGDSLIEAKYDPQLKNMVNQLIRSLTKRASIYNMAVHGQTIATENTNKATRFANLFKAGMPNVAFIETGTNDAIGTAPATVYGNQSALVTHLQGLGFHVVACTLGHRTGENSNFTGYNALVLANGAGANRVLDINANPTMSLANISNPTYYFPDQLHYTPTGQAALAGVPGGGFEDTNTYYVALREALRSITGDSAYVP